MFNVGTRIKGLRKLNKITSVQLASMIEVNQSFISGVENNLKKCSFENIEKICSALGVSLAEFFSAESAELSPELQLLLHNAKRLTPDQVTALNEFIKKIQ